MQNGRVPPHTLPFCPLPPPAVVLELSTWLADEPAELTERIRQAFEMLG